MSDLYAEQLEMQLRFAEEEKEQAVAMACQQAIASERERIVRELEEFAKNPCGEGKYCKHFYDDIGCEKCVALKAIEIVRGEENEKSRSN